MRVAIVVRTLKIGGMERVAISLAEAFHANNHEAHLIYFKNKKNTFSPDQNIIVHKFSLDKIMLFTGIGLLWEIFFRIFNIFLRKSYPLFKGFFTSQLFKIKLSNIENKYGKFDLIIIRGQGTLEMIYQNSDPRMIVVSENVFSYTAMNRFIKNIQIKALYKNRNLVCVSKGVVDNFKQLEIKEHFKSKKIVKITNPINTKQTLTLANAYQPEIKNKFILSVGRIVPAKNIPLLIEAYSYAREHYALTHQLVIVGDGSEISSVKSRIKELSLEEHVHFTGQLTNPFPWMKKADLFILSSKFEGLGMVLLEAMACGTKVVATRSKGGVVDIMKGSLTPYLAEQTSKDLASKIVFALKEENSTNFQEHLQEFEPTHIVNEYIKTFSKES